MVAIKNRITNALAVSFNKDGFTHYLAGEKARYIVGLTNNRGTSIVGDICEKLEAQASYFEGRFANLTVGGWTDVGGETYIDIGTACNSLFYARLLGKLYRQIAIWDSVEMREIRL